MIRAFIWKEWREQRTVAAAILAFGAAAMFLTVQLTADSSGPKSIEALGPRELMAVALAYLAGAVSGAILLADEKEVGTLEFLDTLPSRRRTLWLGKTIAGLLIAIAQCVVLGLLSIAIGCYDEHLGPLAYGLLVIFVGLMSFSWGLFGSALARSTLGAVFQGSISSVAVGVVLAMIFVGVFGARVFSRGPSLQVLAFYVAWVGLGVLGSAYLFTGMDRRRLPRPAKVTDASTHARKPWFAGVRALGWLSIRQAVYVAAGVSAAGLLIGLIVLSPDVYALFVWPGATLMLGVLAGVTTLGEEQVRGVARFWAERRLPLGRLWFVKTIIHFAIACGGALILFLLIFATSLANAPMPLFRSRLTIELRPELWRFLFLTLVYGFVVGLLSSMIFRKTVVAGLVATVCATALTGLIFPSVIGGGAHWWQVWAPAAVLLLTARVVLNSWATERIALRGPVLRVVGGGVLAVGILGIGIGYRVLEIPVSADRLEESGYVDTLPTDTINDPGRKVKAAASQYRKAAEDIRSLYPSPNGLPPVVKQGIVTVDSNDPLIRVARIGWTFEGEGLGPWLDRVFSSDWMKNLDEAADRPLGIFEDPRNLNAYDTFESLGQLREMCYALLARGLQRQQAGDNPAYCQLLRGGLTAARTARNGGGRECAIAGLDCEAILLGGLGEWLNRYGGNANLLRDLLRELERHEREMPVGLEDVQWAEQVILRNTLERLSFWLPIQLGEQRTAVVESRDPKADAEANLIGFAWTVPWERARRERLVRLQSVAPVNQAWLSGLHRPSAWRVDRVDRLTGLDRRGLAIRRLAQLQVALRLFQLEHQRSASALVELVPAFMPNIPIDPYTRDPFSYRVSDGTMPSTGTFSVGRERRIAAIVVAGIAHPIGGLNGPWVPTSVGPPRSTTISPIIVVTPPVRAVPKGFAMLKAGGPIGVRIGSTPTSGTPGDDGVVLIPPPKTAK
ncbi:MAG TPA: ABC transporter permease [Gemmataceae bacterium]|jgi:hypothetical protein|nr:ABC transporter permease [Gemmataceae bacterium]